MTMIDRSPLRDDELVRLLAHDPELLALADALAATSERRAPPGWGRRISVAAAAVLAAAAGALLFVSPWDRGESFVSRALAAVGDGEVLHVVVSRPRPYSVSLVELSSGRVVERAYRQEIWFDAQRRLESTVSTLDGELLDQTLRTPDGGWTESGPIYTCAWIAAHPVEATKARVGCNESMENGTTPQSVPETPPTLDPGLAGFVDRYRAALASGEAKEVAAGELNGREIVWLEFTVPEGERTLVERVAVDALTHRPLRVKQASAEGPERYYDVLEIETLPYTPSLFPMPRLPDLVGKANQQSLAKHEVTIGEAAALLGGTAYWLADRWDGLELVLISEVEWSIGFGGARQVERKRGVELVYAATAPDGTIGPSPSLRIYQANSCLVALAWTCTARDPKDGTMTTGVPGLVRLGRVYVTIVSTGGSRQTSALAVGQALQPHRIAGR